MKLPQLVRPVSKPRLRLVMVVRHPVQLLEWAVEQFRQRLAVLVEPLVTEQRQWWLVPVFGLPPVPLLLHLHAASKDRRVV